MEDKFQNKYRISSARLQGWDYGWNASYFVTTCTKDRENFYGEIINGNIGIDSPVPKNHDDNAIQNLKPKTLVQQRFQNQEKIPFPQSLVVIRPLLPNTRIV